jgi:hypothetical protein
MLPMFGMNLLLRSHPFMYLSYRKTRIFTYLKYFVELSSHSSEYADILLLVTYVMSLQLGMYRHFGASCCFCLQNINVS